MGFSLFGGRFAQGVEVIVAVEDGAEVNENAVRFGGVHGVLRRAGRRFHIVRGGNGLVLDHAGERLGVLHPAGNRGGLRDVADEVLFLIESGEALGERFRIALGEFGNGVDAGGFKEFAEFGANAVDAIEVHHVGEFQDLGFRNAGGLGERFALRGGLGAGEQRIGIGDAGFAELGSDGLADAFYVFNFVVRHV